MNLSVDGCFRGNSSRSIVGGVLRDRQRVILATFVSFLGHQSILFAKLMIMLEELDLAAQFRFNILEIESDSAIMAS